MDKPAQKIISGFFDRRREIYAVPVFCSSERSVSFAGCSRDRVHLKEIIEASLHKDDSDNCFPVIEMGSFAFNVFSGRVPGFCFSLSR